MNTNELEDIWLFGREDDVELKAIKESNKNHLLYVLDFQSYIKIGISTKENFKSRIYHHQKTFKKMGYMLVKENSKALRCSNRHEAKFLESIIKNNFNTSFALKELSVDGYTEIFAIQKREEIEYTLKFYWYNSIYKPQFEIGGIEVEEYSEEKANFLKGLDYFLSK